jgi:hypothetical protein
MGKSRCGTSPTNTVEKGKYVNMQFSIWLPTTQHYQDESLLVVIVTAKVNVKK